MTATSDLRRRIQQALANLSGASLESGARALLADLGYHSAKTADLGTSPEVFLDNLEAFRPEQGAVPRDKVQAAHWRACAFLFQLTNDEIPSLSAGQATLGTDPQVARGQIESFVFVAIHLDGEHWTRTELASITRELNKRFPMPAIMLYRHGGLLSLAVIDRRQHRLDGTRDVLESRITVVKDVRVDNPHRAHIDILASLALQNLGERRRPGNFRELYDAWIETLSTQALNKRFYTELAWWYFWAVKQVAFPIGGGADAEKRHAVAVIRLLTRLIFIWFIKEKGLVPDALFERGALRSLLKTDPADHPEDGNYYLAVLQNLFFATLNVEMGDERRWAQEGAGMKGDRLVHSLYRHKTLFKDPAGAIEQFARIPFLNGGLFECLDRDITERDFQRQPELRALAVQEGGGWVQRVDGFSRRKDAQPQVPNKLFFGGDANADLNAELGTKGKRVPVQGLLDIFARYKFTVDENTPVEEEVALDPELLGKVFENLLASYNEDTQSTARKLSGSFYTPREVVDYMVDETLVAYFRRTVTAIAEDDPAHETALARPVNGVLEMGAGPGELDLPMPEDEALGEPLPERAEVKLRQLLSYSEDGNPFDADATTRLIAAIERLKVLDPACGSGAFPMGMLHKLVHVLRKLDPGNALWKAQNRSPLEAQLATARTIPDLALRVAKVEEAEAALAKFDRDFADGRQADYTRKLYLIEKCIHGVDIQPIAVQIAKLRFFIALVVSQRTEPGKPNSGITPLPNLETKIVAADSLMPIDRPQQLGLRDPSIDEKERELAEANERYFAARTARTKRKWRERIFELRDELAALLEQDRFLSKGAARQLVHWNPFDQNAAADFFDPEWMFQLADGFDITIGNPPYVRHEDISEQAPLLKPHYESAASRADLYVFFYERAVRLLKPDGAFAFITSNKWYRAKYGEKLREWMNRHTRLRKIIDFGDEAVFDAIAYPTIVIATRRAQPVKAPAAGDEVWALNWAGQAAVTTFPSVFEVESFPVPQAALRKDGWQLEPPVKRRLLDRIRLAGKPLGEYVKGRLYYGIKTGLNEAFVIDGAARERLIAEDPKSSELIKPYLRGRDVKRWKVEWAGLYLIVFPYGFHAQLHRYPAILRHLSQYQADLKKRGQCTSSRSGKDEGQHHWLELDNNPRPEYLAAFDKPKIFVPAIEDGVEYAPDLNGYYGNDKTNIIVTEDWRYVLGVLNSSVSWWLTQQMFSGKQGGFYEFKPMYVSQVPIPAANDKQRRAMNAAVNAVLVSRSPQLEQLINGLAYELFFPDDLYAKNIRLSDACEAAGLERLSGLQGQTLSTAVQALAATIFATSHPIYSMLFDLQALDVVRLIEGKV